MSDTPESNKAKIAFTPLFANDDAYWVPLKVSCKLERERDEAREALAEIERYGTEEINAAVRLRRKLATALVERDEAREELHDIKLNLGDDAEGCTLLHAVCALQNERDEARGENSKLRDIAERAINDFNGCKARQLRAELGQLKGGAK